MVIAGLYLIFLIVLVGPFTNRWIERNLEVFLFIMGVISATLSQAWTVELLKEGTVAPISITLAVLAAGVLFQRLRGGIKRGMKVVLSRVNFAAVIFAGIVALALLSSIISAIIAALILVEFINVLPLHRRSEVHLTVITCFAIGVGAALTPLGEPLSTIVVSKLNGPPHHATFFYLAGLLGPYAVAVIVILGIFGSLLVRDSTGDTAPTLAAAEKEETVTKVFVRVGKVYLFVMALIFLGAGFSPLIDLYFVNISSQIIFWANIASAILDNATLAAAEIGPTLSEAQIKSALWGLLIAGGMLIPGNIPNIIAAHSLNIKSTEWACLGVPLGLVLMTLTAVLLAFHVI